MMSSELWAALFSALGSAVGAFGGIALNTSLMSYRLEQLERKVDKHNTVVERTFRLEERQEAADQRLDRLEQKVG